MTRADEVERAARALLAAIAKEQDWGDANLDPDNFGCACDGGVADEPLPIHALPCSSCRARSVKRNAIALRDALALPSPTGGACPTCGSDDTARRQDPCFNGGARVDPFHAPSKEAPRG